MFESVMWKYMKEEPVLLSTLLKVNAVKNQIKEMRDIKSLYLVGHGSSFNALSAIAPFIASLSHVRTYGYTPSGFRYNAKSIDFEEKENTWVLGISQTGTSRGVLEALEEAKKKGFKVLGITNVKDSPLDLLADVTLYLECGEEESNAKTKGYSSTLVILMMLGIELAALKGIICESDYDELYNELMQQTNEIDQVFEKTVEWCKAKKYGKNMENIFVVGNGMNFATSMEGQLKIMETHCIPTMFNDIEEFSHGMHRALNEKSHVLLINSEIDKELTEKTFDYLRMKQIPVLMINAEEPKEDDDVINVGKYKMSSSILVITAVIQAISAFVPELHGLDPNRNANNDYTDWVATRV